MGGSSNRFLNVMEVAILVPVLVPVLPTYLRYRGEVGIKVSLDIREGSTADCSPSLGLDLARHS